MTRSKYIAMRAHKRAPVTEEEVEEIARMWGAGERSEDIARKFGMSESSLQKLASRKREIMPARVHSKEWKVGAIDKMEEMKAAGKTMADIAKEIGVSRQALFKLVKEKKARQTVKAIPELPAPAAYEPSGLRKVERVTITGARVSLPYVSFKVVEEPA